MAYWLNPRAGERAGATNKHATTARQLLRVCVNRARRRVISCHVT